MRVLLDTADIDEINWAAGTGLIDGVITDPSSLSASLYHGDYRTQLGEIARAARGLVFAEVIAVDAAAIVREGRELARVADNVAVSVPLIEEGVLAMRELADAGVRVNATLVFNAAQGVLAAKAGAAFVSASLAPLDEIGADGEAMLLDLRRIFERYRFECDIVATGVRTLSHFIQAARAGADAIAVPPGVLRSLLVHPLTDRGLDQFLNDWSKRPRGRGFE